MGANFTLVCKRCEKVIMLTRNARVPRPVKWGLCTMCTPRKIHNHREAPMVQLANGEFRCISPQ